MLTGERQVASTDLKGDAFDNATPVTVMGSFKNSSAARDSLIRRGTVAVKAEVGDLVLHWYKHARMVSTLPSRTPKELKNLYGNEVNGKLSDIGASNVAA